MTLGITQYGIVQQHKDGATTILRPGKNGGPGTEIAVPPELADAYRLATGDVAAGETEPLAGEEAPRDFGAESEDAEAWDAQFDEPSARWNDSVPAATEAARVPTERLTRIERINGLTLEEVEERPFPRSRRSHSERVPPDRWLPLGVGPDDATGRMLDFAAPLGIGCAGAIFGPHGSGLTRALRAVLHGVTTHAPDCVPIVLLLRARGEEVTDWRRRFPQADIVVCSAAFGEGTSGQVLRMCDLTLEAAQRQTEMGRDVVLLVDSLTGLWGAMLEMEAADAQAEADQSGARQRMREWVQKAGCFHGEMPLGGSLGGSLTIIGAVWHQPIDAEQEEYRETHPHLRLPEHLLPELAWRVSLSDTLARQRLYPAIDVRQCLSQHEERFLPPDIMEGLWKARATLPRRDPLACYQRVMDALESTADLRQMLDGLIAESDASQRIEEKRM